MATHDFLNHTERFLAVIAGVVQSHRVSLSRTGPKVLTHAVFIVGNHGIGGIEDVRSRAVVLFELDNVLDLILAHEIGHISDPCSAEGVNGLVIIADAKDGTRVFGRVRQDLNPAVLQSIGVLKLIDEDELKALGIVLAKQRIFL